MLAFAQLFAALDRTTRTSGKVAALADYFRCTPPADAAWALWFLCGRRLKRAVKTAHLRQCAAEVAGLPLWLVEACCEHVGHLGETLALLLPPNSNPAPPPLAELVERRLLPLAGAPEATQRELLRAAWSELDTPQRLLWHRLITGHFRAGAWRALLVRALATLAGVEPLVMTHRLMGEWRPTPADLSRLLSGASAEDAAVRGACLIQTDLFITEEAATPLPVPLRLSAPRPATSRG
jgi:DNA ligase 1